MAHEKSLNEPDGGCRRTCRRRSVAFHPRGRRIHRRRWRKAAPSSATARRPGMPLHGPYGARIDEKCAMRESCGAFRRRSLRHDCANCDLIGPCVRRRGRRDARDGLAVRHRRGSMRQNRRRNPLGRRVVGHDGAFMRRYRRRHAPRSRSRRHAPRHQGPGLPLSHPGGARQVRGVVATHDDALVVRPVGPLREPAPGPRARRPSAGPGARRQAWPKRRYDARGPRVGASRVARRSLRHRSPPDPSRRCGSSSKPWCAQPPT